MSARDVLSLIGTAVGGLIGWAGEPAPAADPAALRELFADLGLPAGDLDEAVRRFQSQVGLEPDGVAGPRTVHLLARHAADARELRRQWGSWTISSSVSTSAPPAAKAS